MTPLPVDPRCDVDLVDVIRAMWQRKERGEKDALAGLLAAGRKPTLIVCEKMKDGK